jgi:hypothetical protein
METNSDGTTREVCVVTRNLFLGVNLAREALDIANQRGGLCVLFKFSLRKMSVVSVSLLY